MPSNAQTRKLVNAERLERAKKGLIVNTARGDLIDEPALADAIESGHIAGGAGLDVFERSRPSISASRCCRRSSPRRTSPHPREGQNWSAKKPLKRYAIF